MSIEKIKELAENYAHCYSFVGDDSMEAARDKLLYALDEQQDIIDGMKSLIIDLQASLRPISNTSANMLIKCAEERKMLGI